MAELGLELRWSGWNLCSWPLCLPEAGDSGHFVTSEFPAETHTRLAISHHLCDLKLGLFLHLWAPHARSVSRGSSYCLPTLQMRWRDQPRPLNQPGHLNNPFALPSPVLITPPFLCTDLRSGTLVLKRRQESSLSLNPTLP